MPYIPRLDTFRAIAALAVVFGHYGGFAPSALAHINFAGAGVAFFFVLSGFLITTVLLQDSDSGIGSALARFYLRRSFRIFPLYYLALAAGVICGIRGFQDSLPWSAVYLTNFGIIASGQAPYYATHLWTLAVEEQFYLFWPIVVLALGPRRAIGAAGALICAALYYKQVASGLWLTYSPFSALDFLCSGALVALARTAVPLCRIELSLRIALPIAIPFLLVMSEDLRPTVMRLAAPIGDTVNYMIPISFSVMSCWLIARAVLSGPAASSWGGNILPWLGRISYGIYVYHLPVRYFVDLLDPNWLWYWRFAGVGATIAIAWASYRFVEAPMIRLGRQIAEGFRAAKPATI